MFGAPDRSVCVAHCSVRKRGTPERVRGSRPDYHCAVSGELVISRAKLGMLMHLETELNQSGGQVNGGNGTIYVTTTSLSISPATTYNRQGPGCCSP